MLTNCNILGQIEGLSPLRLIATVFHFRSDINDDKIQPNQMAEEMEDSIKLGEEGNLLDFILTNEIYISVFSAGLFFHHQPSFMNKEDQSYSLPKRYQSPFLLSSLLFCKKSVCNVQMYCPYTCVFLSPQSCFIGC